MSTNSMLIVKNGRTMIHIVFDLDDTLITGFEISDIDTLLREYPFVEHFKNLNLLFKAEGLYYIIHPGAVELFQILTSMMDKIKISFFSSATPEMNHARVAELLITMLGHEKYDSIKADIRIYSKDELKRTERGLYYKDLKTCVTNDEEMSSTILVDDDITYCAPGQENHFLKIYALDSETLTKAYNQFIDNKPLKNIFTSSDDLYLRTNHLFYLSSRLFKAIAQTNKKMCPLADVLNNIDVNRKADYEYRQFHSKLACKESYYLEGLKLLQTVNPNLELITPDSFLSLKRTPEIERPTTISSLSMWSSSSDIEKEMSRAARHDVRNQRVCCTIL